MQTTPLGEPVCGEWISTDIPPPRFGVYQCIYILSTKDSPRNQHYMRPLSYRNEWRSVCGKKLHYPAWVPPAGKKFNNCYWGRIVIVLYWLREFRLPQLPRTAHDEMLKLESGIPPKEIRGDYGNHS